MSDFYESPFFNNTTVQPVQGFQPTQQPPIPQRSPMQPIASPENNIKSGGFKFTIKKDNESDTSGVNLEALASDEPTTVKRRRGRPRKEESSTGIIKAEPEVVNSTAYTYQETTEMLRGTLCQIDDLATEVRRELDSVINSRTLKSKYNVMVGLSGNLGDILNTKISAIKEINNSIRNSNELDYKINKDNKALEGNVNDDKRLMDMYNAFIQSPIAQQQNVMGPNIMDATLLNGSPVQKTTLGGASVNENSFIGETDTGYLSYVTNMTPEQRLMALEGNPNIKMCLIYDAATQNKTFQMMDMSTGQPVPGLPARDAMFLEDTTIDLKNNIAKNINLNETYPLIVLNQNVVNEY